MATDFFLQVDGIEGESNDKNHGKWIELSSFEFGSAQNIEQNRGTDVAGRGQFKPFSFIHPVDKATPKLQHFCMSGQKISKVKLESCRAILGVQTPVCEVTLENAKVAKAQVMMQEVNGTMQLVEKIEMICAKMTWKVTPIKSDNTKGGAIEASFDQVSNS